uniref:Immunoglobulin superfamily member 10 n=1 Tax=Pavo cristatus TaxID=9049 RepID=A0A8C9F846_PAVCR
MSPISFDKEDNVTVLMALQLDRTATTLSTLHIQYFADAQIVLPAVDQKKEGNNWTVISRDNKTQTEHTVLVGGTVQLDCQAMGEPAPAIEWILADGSKVRAPYVSEDGRIIVVKSGTFTLRTADTFDTGLYHCIGTNYNDADILTFRITVVDPYVEHSSVNGAQISAALGSILDLPCTSSAVPDAAISWVLPDRWMVLPNGTLVIARAALQDGGQYRCTATNALGTARLLATLAVVAYPPRIAGGTRLLTAHAGMPVAMRCPAEGRPPPSISWVLANETHVSSSSQGNQKVLVRLDGTLMIKDVTVYDRGLYTCTATNPAGTDTLTVKLQVIAAPPVILEEKRQQITATVGQDLSLPCTAEGNPQPRVHWVLSEGTVVKPLQMGSRIHVYPNGSLVIEAVTEKDAGDYLCVARNKIGDDLILMKVSITMKPAKIDQKQYFKKLVPYGKDFQVDCKASGSPAPEISWSLPDGTVINNAMLADDSGRRTRRYVLFDNGTLYLNRAGVTEEGDYTCYAQNTLGRDEMKIHITVVTAAPQIKHSYKTYIKVKAGDTALLDCEAAGEPKPKIFWLLPSKTDLENFHTGLKFSYWINNVHLVWLSEAWIRKQECPRTKAQILLRCRLPS